MVNAPSSLDDYRRDIGRALALLAARAPDYVKGRDFYDGTRAEVSASKLVEKIIAKSAGAMPLSFAHIPVDVVCDKVVFSGITVSDETLDAQLTAIADRNDLEDEVDDWLLKAGYFGDYYVIVEPTEEEEGDGGQVAIVADGITWVGSSPLSTVVVYDAKDERTPVYGAKVWRKGADWHARLFYDDCTVKLIAENVAEDLELKAEKFDADVPFGGEDGDERIPHPGGRMLIHHLALGGKPYGVPLHRKAWGPQDAITKVSATNLNNVDAQGLPTRYALLEAGGEVDDDIDDDFGDEGPGEGDGTAGPSQGSHVKGVPGAIALLRGIKAVGTFSATGSDDFLKNLDWYVRAMAIATGVPIWEFDQKTGDQPSGESRRRAEGRVNRRAERVQRNAAAFLKNVADTTLALLGREAEVAVAFRPTETSTDTEGIALVAAKVKAGVPIRQALAEAGYTDEQVDEWYPKGAPNVTPDLLAVVAQALAQLGNALTLGVITREELADMLPAILTAARGEGPAVAPVDIAAGAVGVA